jgi:hypothetical protein
MSQPDERWVNRERVTETLIANFNEGTMAVVVETRGKSAGVAIYIKGQKFYAYPKLAYDVARAIDQAAKNVEIIEEGWRRL